MPSHTPVSDFFCEVDSSFRYDRMFLCLQNCCWEIASDEMLPSVPAGAAPQQFPALPACVEEVNFDLLQAEGSLQVEDVKDAYTQQQLKEVLSSPEFRAFLETIELDSDIQLTSAAAPPGLQQLEFENVKMPSSDQNRLRKSNNASPVIPLSVQQEQLDSIDSQAIAQSHWLQTDDTQFSYLLIPDEEVDAAAAAAAAGQPMPTERLGSAQTSPPDQTADQTVPFRRHDSVCSALSACSDVVVKNERRSISETESTISPPFTPSASQPHSTSSSSSRRRGRPCFDNVSLIIAACVKGFGPLESLRRYAM